MKIRLRDGLPLVAVTLQYHSQQIELEDVLLDTGSASSVFSADRLLAIDLKYEPDDPVHRIRGVGGSEFVFSKRVDRLTVDDMALNGLPVEIGAMAYGFLLDGILGLDFLVPVGAVIDLDRMEVMASVSPASQESNPT